MVGPCSGGRPMTLLRISVDSDDDARYLARTAKRLWTMAERTTGLVGADPVRVRERLERRDRHDRHIRLLSQTVA